MKRDFLKRFYAYLSEENPENNPGGGQPDDERKKEGPEKEKEVDPNPSDDYKKRYESLQAESEKNKKELEELRALKKKQEDAEKSAEEKVIERDKRIEELEIERKREKLALKEGLDPDLWEFITAKEEDGIKAQIEKLKKTQAKEEESKEPKGETGNKSQFGGSKEEKKEKPVNRMANLSAALMKKK